MTINYSISSIKRNTSTIRHLMIMKIAWLPRMMERLSRPLMEEVKYPEYLDTEEKWNECVQKMSGLGAFQEMHDKLLDDENVVTLDVLKIMKRLTKDSMDLHGNEDVMCLMEVVEAIMRYMVISHHEETRLREDAEDLEEAARLTKELDQTKDEDKEEVDIEVIFDEIDS